MSDADTLVSARHFEYLRQRTQGDDAFLTQLKQAAREAGIPPIWIGEAQASFLSILMRLCAAKTVVEVGTLAGSTAVVLGRAVGPAGHVTTLELSDAHADFAEHWIARSDVAGRVSVVRGPAADALAAMRSGSVDALLLDADKGGYAAYLRQARRLLRPGGLLLADNAFAFGQLFHEQPSDREAPAVQAFNEIMAQDDAFDAVIVPLGDGVWVGVRRPG